MVWRKEGWGGESFLLYLVWSKLSFLSPVALLEKEIDYLEFIFWVVFFLFSFFFQRQSGYG